MTEIPEKTAKLPDAIERRQRTSRREEQAASDHSMAVPAELDANFPEGLPRQLARVARTAADDLSGLRELLSLGLVVGLFGSLDRRIHELDPPPDEDGGRAGSAGHSDEGRPSGMRPETECRGHGQFTTRDSELTIFSRSTR